MNMTIVKGLPAPPRTAKNRIYPFAEMEVGDCLIVGLDRRKSVSGAAKTYGASSGKRFTVRTLPDGVHVWRLS